MVELSKAAAAAATGSLSGSSSSNNKVRYHTEIKPTGLNAPLFEAGATCCSGLKVETKTERDGSEKLGETRAVAVLEID